MDEQVALHNFLSSLQIRPTTPQRSRTLSLRTANQRRNRLPRYLRLVHTKALVLAIQFQWSKGYTFGLQRRQRVQYFAVIQRVTMDSASATPLSRFCLTTLFFTLDVNGTPNVNRCNTAGRCSFRTRKQLGHSAERNTVWTICPTTAQSGKSRRQILYHWTT